VESRWQQSDHKGGGGVESTGLYQILHYLASATVQP
jgi:hypothetical protein